MYMMNLHLWWLLALIPAGMLLILWIQRRTAVSPYGVAATLCKMTTTKPQLVRLQRFFLYLAIFFIVLALLRPQWGLRKETVETRGLDIVFALDISKSMYAEDVQPDRLTRARLTIMDLLQRLPGNRAGLVVFAGSASAVCPLTTDYAALDVFLQSVSGFGEAVPGTNLENALRVGSTLFEDKAPQDKLFIIFTDGESHEGSLDALRGLATQRQIIVVPVAVGTSGGQPVPDYDEQGNRLGYKKDARGNIVISHLDLESLKKIADIGPYTVETASIRMPLDIRNFKQGKLRDTRIALYTERYQGFLLVGMFFLLLAYLVPTYRDPFTEER